MICSWFAFWFQKTSDLGTNINLKIQKNDSFSLLFHFYAQERITPVTFSSFIKSDKSTLFSPVLKKSNSFMLLFKKSKIENC